MTTHTTPDEIHQAAQLGREAYELGQPTAAPTLDPGMTRLIGARPVGTGAAELFAAWLNAYAAAAERAAADTQRAVSLSEINAQDAAAIAQRNPAARHCADVAAAGLASARRSLAHRTAEAQAARAAAVDEAAARGIAVEAAARLTEVMGGRGIDDDAFADLAEQANTLPVDEVRRLTSRLRVALDGKAGHWHNGRDLPFRLAKVPGPLAGPPAYMWHRAGLPIELRTVSVLPRVLLDFNGTAYYERLSPNNGAQVIAQATSDDGPAVYRVFWKHTDGEWWSVTDVMLRSRLAAWNGCPRERHLPVRGVAAWLDRVVQATTAAAA